MRKALILAVVLAAAVIAPHALSIGAQESPAPQQAPAAPPPPVYTGPVIVIDPAHGGTDSGARGETVVEKDVDLQMARAVRAELERQGYHTLLTRNDDSNPSYDDRAAVANAHRDAIFVSLHVASTGANGTVRAYYMQLATPMPAAAAGGAANAKAPASVATGLTAWEEAQRPYLGASRRLADLVQGELAQAFSGSPTASTGVPVRTLRSVAAPAVAVEISSVITPTPDLLTASATPMGAAIARAIAAYRQANAGGAR